MNNKTALITGASSGIGKELAKIHASNGGDLVIVARSEDKLQTLSEELKSAYNISVNIIVKDLTLPEAPKEIYDEVSSAGIVIEYLINNAGFGGVGYFYERNWEDDLAMIHLNIIALTALTRYFLPNMIERNSGRILNVSSTAALIPGPLQAVYYATKAFVTSFSNALAQELSQTDITVTSLMPGATETEFGRTSGMDKTSLFSDPYSADVVAKDGYQAMLKGELNCITGVSFSQKISLKLAPLLPTKLLLKQIFEMQKPKD